MPNEMIDRAYQLARQDPLGIVIEDRSGSESLHDLPPEQMDGRTDNVKEDSMYHPSKNGEDNDNSLSSIPSIEDAPIHHETEDLGLTNSVNNTHDNNTMTNVEDNTNAAPHEMSGYIEPQNANGSDNNVHSKNGGQQAPNAADVASMDNGIGSTAGVIDSTPTRVSTKLEVQYIGDPPPLQAQLEDRKLTVNVCSTEEEPEEQPQAEPNETNTTTNGTHTTNTTEDQIAAIEAEMGHTYGTYIRAGLRSQCWHNPISCQEKNLRHQQK
eukprot:10605881-Ditylum_brightwellii.AAC.1